MLESPWKDVYQAKAIRKQFVAFIDLLGFSAALKDVGRCNAILATLKTLSDISCSYSHQVMDRGDGEKNGHAFQAAISSFSDSIIISFPIDSPELPDRHIDTMLLYVRSIISYIAWNAIRSRLLIRGGMAIGDLYHHDGIVFGPALVEAYETERSIAIYPRVAFGPSVKGNPEYAGVLDGDVCQVHDDGVIAVDYIAGLVGLGNAIDHGIDPSSIERIPEVREIVERELLLLGKGAAMKSHMKWAWFKKCFEERLGVSPEYKSLVTSS